MAKSVSKYENSAKNCREFTQLNNAYLDVEWHRQMAELDALLLKGTLSMIFGLQPDKTSQIIDVP
jgi:hypothetical protein